MAYTKRLLKGISIDPYYRLPTGDTAFHTGDEEKERSGEIFEKNKKMIDEFKQEHEDESKKK